MLQPLLTAVSPREDTKLLLAYETGEQKVFDAAPYATGVWYSELLDPSYFRQVRLLKGGVGIEWPHGQDIAPHELYHDSVAL